MSTSIKARVHAPTAPMWQRATAYSIGWSFIATGLIALNSFPIAHALLEIGAFILTVAPFALYRRGARQSQITLFPGRIMIGGQLEFKRVIASRDLRGAFVARDQNRFILSLEEKSTPRSPVSIELDDERAAKEIRKALGIRREGFGEMRWSLEARNIDIALAVVRVATIVALAGGLENWFDWIVPLLLLVGVGLFSLVGAIIQNPSLVMARVGIRTAETGDVFAAPWTQLESIETEPSAIVATTTDKIPHKIECEPVRWVRFGMNEDERSLLVAQLRNGIARANGSPGASDEAFEIAQLKRGDASAVDWLARIDALAATQSEAGYRGSHFSPEDLWRAVENHETAPDVRAAAARILIRISPEKSHDRVAAVLASIHDDTERAHLRAALDSDLEMAAREVEALDYEMIDRG